MSNSAKLENITSKIVQFDVMFLVIGLYLVLFSSLFYEPFSIKDLYNAKRSYQLILFLILLLIFPFYFRSIRNYNVLNKYVEIVFFIILLVGIFSALRANNVDWALLEVSHYTSVVLLLIIIGKVASKYKERYVNALYIIALVYVFIYTIKFLISYNLSLFSSFPQWPGNSLSVGYTGFANIRFFNQTQTWTLPLVIMASWYSLNNYYRKIGLLTSILAIMWGVLIIASEVRGTLIGVGIAGLITVLLIRKRIYFVSLNTLLLISAFFMYYIMYNVVFSTSTTVAGNLASTDTARYEIWERLITEIPDKFFLGYGPMHYASISKYHILNHPHNWLLQLLYEWGIISTLLLTAVIIYGLYSYYKDIKTTEIDFYSKYYTLKIGVFWSLMSALIHGLLSGIIVSPLSQTWFILVGAIALGTYDGSSNSGWNQKFSVLQKKYKGLIIVLAYMVTISGYTSWFMQNDLDRTYIDKIYKERTGKDVLMPRFWAQGSIGVEELYIPHKD